MEFNRDDETTKAETKREMMRENPEQAAAYDTIVEHVRSGVSSRRVQELTISACLFLGA